MSLLIIVHEDSINSIISEAAAVAQQVLRACQNIENKKSSCMQNISRGSEYLVTYGLLQFLKM